MMDRKQEAQIAEMPAVSRRAVVTAGVQPQQLQRFSPQRKRVQKASMIT